MKYKLEYTIANSESGKESISFHLEMILINLLKGYKLDQIAKERSVTFAIGIDISMITKTLNAITFGIKMNDISGVNHITNKSLVHDLQTRDNSYPCKITLAKETKAIFQDIKKEFMFLHNFRE